MDYKCTLCKGQFGDPRLLKCYHSFCRLCLDDYLMVSYNDGQFSCPLCKELNDVPVNGARGLPKNRFCDGTKNKIVCDLCPHRQKADSICRDCNTNLCKSCLLNHIKLNGSVFHNVTSLPAEREDQGELCSMHKNQELLYYCDTCETPICNICNVTDHQTHRSKDIASKAIMLRTNFGSSLQQLTSSADVNSLQSKVNDQQRKIKAYQQDAISAIDERTRELHKIVDEIRGYFVRKVVSENIDVKKQLEDNQEKLNTNVAAVAEIAKFGRTFLENACDIDVVVHITEMQKQLQKLQNIDIHIAEIKQKMFYPSHADYTNIEMKKIFGSFEKQNLRPKEIKSISRLAELRRANSDGVREMSASSSSHAYLNGDVRSSSDNSQRPIEVGRKRQHFSCSNSLVTSFIFLSDSSVCVCLGKEGKLEMFNRSGRKKGTLTFHHPIDDVVVDSKDNIYVSSNFEKKIIKVENDKKEVFAETRHCVRGLAFDGNGSLLAGITIKDSILDAKQEGYVTEISQQNKVRRVVDNSIIRYPARIATGSDHRIIISDWIQRNVIIFRNGRHLGTYSGSTDNPDEFVPRGVCSLSTGDVIVVDNFLNSLHWLSPECKLRRIISVGDNLLWSVSVDRSDNVWVGTDDGQVIPVDLF